ncbi:hypothetical protein ACIBO2_19660 [Nonomuraea sp. NPDC050022]|uniref:aromatic-ring hydroxylase C-terminal domain-containing protein n=1 Tax=Nonomuraea sp. NPDC050022 TaxID=3364358 RepID=UPI0037AAF7F8
MLGGPEIDALRAMLAELLAVERVNRRLAEEVSGIGIRYDMGQCGHALAGRRMPYRTLRILSGGARSDTLRLLRPPRGVLLMLVDGPWASVAEGWRDRIDIVRAETENPQVTCAMIRSDGHVAWATSGDPDAGGLLAALTRCFGLPRHRKRQ